MRRQKPHSRIRRGAVLVISMIFLLIFLPLAVSIAAMSGANLQIAKNYHTNNNAFSAAESGLEVFRYWMNDLSMSLDVPAGERLPTLVDNLQNRFYDAGVSNITVYYNGSEVTVSSVSINSHSSQTFTAVIQQIEDDILKLDVTGRSDQVTTTISTHFDFVTQANPIFNHGIATRGPLHMNGNAGLEVAVGSSVYIDGEGADYALTMEGDSEISGSVSISDPYASVDVSSNSMIGGQSGAEAVENHVSTDVDAIDFPVPDVSSFAQYIQNVVDANTDTSSDLTLDNITIAAGTNPDFTGNVNLRGIVFIEQPNIVTFSGNATVTGIIVGNGDVQAPSDLNQIVFSGNVETYGVSELPLDEEQFDGLRDKTGSFLLAPGFSASFSGNASVTSGVIAANGITFSGNAGGNIQGTIMNYSQTPISIAGNSNLTLTPSAGSSNPAGFTPIKVLEFIPSSYSQIH